MTEKRLSPLPLFYLSLELSPFNLGSPPPKLDLEARIGTAIWEMQEERVGVSGIETEKESCWEISMPGVGAYCEALGSQVRVSIPEAGVTTPQSLVGNCSSRVSNSQAPPAVCPREAAASSVSFEEAHRQRCSWEGLVPCKDKAPWITVVPRQHQPHSSPFLAASAFTLTSDNHFLGLEKERLFSPRT